jgi:hypothetical protein
MSTEPPRISEDAWGNDMLVQETKRVGFTWGRPHSRRMRAFVLAEVEATTGDVLVAAAPSNRGLVQIIA